MNTAARRTTELSTSSWRVAESFPFKLKNSFFLLRKKPLTLEIETQSQYEDRLAFFPAFGFTFLGVFAARASDVQTAASVKSYLLKSLEKVTRPLQDFVANSEAYSALIAANGGSVEAAYKAEPKKIEQLIAKMQGELQSDG